MSELSVIAKQVDRDKYKAIYCKCGGTLMHNGKLLSEFYDDSGRIDKLQELGDIYCLGERLSADEKGTGSVTKAYARDLGEKLVPAEFYTQEELFDLDEVSYLYVFTKEGKWIYCGIGELEEQLHDVKKALAFAEDIETLDEQTEQGDIVQGMA